MHFRTTAFHHFTCSYNFRFPVQGFAIYTFFSTAYLLVFVPKSTKWLAFPILMLVTWLTAILLVLFSPLGIKYSAGNFASNYAPKRLIINYARLSVYDSGEQ
jgi:hypothetical protein